SPTTTTYSGISSYQNSTFQPRSPPNQSANYPPLDSVVIAKAHFDELYKYLASYLAKEPANSRTSARQKLTRLTRQQFQELSTDVYDELLRRTNNSAENEVPFLPVRDDFHPKRNQARQKLATLPASRFKDLSSDVFYELSRRYPEFKEQVCSLLSGPMVSLSHKLQAGIQDKPSDEYPPPEYSSTSDPPPVPPLSNFKQNMEKSFYGDRRQPSEVSLDNTITGRSETTSPSRRKPSQDGFNLGRQRSLRSQDLTGRRFEDRQEREFLVHRPGGSISESTTSNGNAQSATSGVIIPNKSTIAEEEIEVPYGRQTRDSSSTAMLDDGDRDRHTDGEQESSPMVGGLNGLSARLKQVDEEDNSPLRNGVPSTGEDYFDRMSYGRTSVASDRSASKIPGEEEEKIRREYEYKIATMQNKIAGLERDLEDADEKGRNNADGNVRAAQLEQELNEFRKRADEHANAMRALQKELEELREDRARDREREHRRQQEHEEELQILRDRCETLEAERTNGGGGADPQLFRQLQSDMRGLMEELTELSRRNDELMTAKDADLAVIRDLDTQCKDYKRKYELAKTELRGLKATSQLFLQPPKTDDNLPMSPDGAILDIHVTAFVSAVDSLLTAGRSNSPTRVLAPMKAVVNAVTAITDDLRQFERRPRSDEVDLDVLRSLRDRAEATLSNLVVATKSHATGAGMSPVSLLDAAASHVSSTVTEIARIAFIRRATPAEQEQFHVMQPTANGRTSGTRSVEEVSSPPRGTPPTGTAPLRNGAGDSMSRVFFGRKGTRNGMGDDERERKGLSDPSNSSDGSSPPPIFERRMNGVASGDSAAQETPEDAWNELKPYLEAQSDAIVVAIQNVVNGIRSPTPPPTLGENITQIITIVASIVAVCKDNLPPNSVQQGREYLKQLSDNANKLSELQAGPPDTITKESRQVAKSIFAIANIMKSLGKM
ncbi:hypothetical protein BDM02DRAFT_3082236, partial [Thelephora ganbajun]